MKVVLLTTARGQRPATLATLRAQLGLRPGDGTELSVISWHRPRLALPVDTNLLVGPDFNVRRNARVLPVADPSLVLDDELEDELGESDGLGAAEEADEAGGESLDVAPPEARPATPLGPVYHPRRVVKAVTWRAKRSRRAIRTNPTVVRVRNSTKLRRLRNTVAPGGLGSRYAVACLLARNVHAEIERADLVVALDANTHRAAWLLARRHPGPAFVVGTAAGKRVLAERAAHV